MTPKLNDELRRAIDQQGESPVEVVHPGTNKVYVLVDRDVYQRILPLLTDEPLCEQEQRFLIQQAGRRAGWDDPEMDAYDDYDAHASPPSSS